MGSILEIGAAIISQSQHRVEVAAQNVANITTPGYKKRGYVSQQVGFDNLLQDQPVPLSIATDFTKGKQIDTGSPFDLTIAGDGFFTVRSGTQQFYTRQGQFQRDSEGRLVTAGGMILQAKGGGDIVLKGGAFKVAEDGTVTEGGQPTARLAIVDFANRQVLAAADGGMFSAPESAAADIDLPSVRQGALEASNVSTGDEMVSMMQALRRAETGQRLVTTYDDLMGRALTVFGQA